MNLTEQLTAELKSTISDLYSTEISDNQIQLQKTRPEFSGDLTLVTFPLLKISKKNPAETAQEIGDRILKNSALVTEFEIVKGFLNLTISADFWIKAFKIIAKESLAENQSTKPHIMVEYASPNTNKPLHLGHMRNIFLGDSVANILQAYGHKITRTQIINDRGIHICKSMMAWNHFGESSTPESTKMKGDHFVGKYYVRFDKELKAQTAEIMPKWESGDFQEVPDNVVAEFNRLKGAHKEKEGDEKAQKGIAGKMKELVVNYTPIMLETKTMLQAWENNDEDVRNLWSTMNQWVYDGFDATYTKMRVKFDKLYYESTTYLTGKELVEEGLNKRVFYKQEDGSVWVDLTDKGLDKKLVLRGDGTAVYMTQDIGTALERMRDFSDLNGIVYTVGNEQDYHFKVLFLILEKLGFNWAKNCHHLSYGMVELPEGKMKSREGTVVDADDLMDEVISVAQEMTEERGHLEGMDDAQRNELYQTVGLGGLKYYLLKVDPSKSMTFNPKESVDLQGNTGPFIQYTYARINSILAKRDEVSAYPDSIEMAKVEKELIVQLLDAKNVLADAAENYSPAVICNYTYDLAKSFNSFYQNIDIFREENKDLKNFRLELTESVGRVIEFNMNLLGIQVPAKM
ncbi:MAG: arginine--tRNA ligase [Crocinitomicaceae bacterium]|nr:arginine--tRNA ligase [Crocinitomicaceae bacterium]